MRQQLIHAGAPSDLVAYLESCFDQPLHRTVVGFFERPGNRSQAVGEKVQPSGSGNIAVDLPERPSGCVSGVRIQFLFGLLLHLVQFREVGMKHVDLAAQFQQLRRVWDRQRKTFDGQNILGHDLSGRSVAPGRGFDQLAVSIG